MISLLECSQEVIGERNFEIFELFSEALSVLGHTSNVSFVCHT